jgi:hypothetical protein
VRETVTDLLLLAAAGDPVAAIDHFLKFPLPATVLSCDPTTAPPACPTACAWS